jgi:hypothetical protein
MFLSPKRIFFLALKFMLKATLFCFVQFIPKASWDEFEHFCIYHKQKFPFFTQDMISLSYFHNIYICSSYNVKKE